MSASASVDVLPDECVHPVGRLFTGGAETRAITSRKAESDIGAPSAAILNVSNKPDVARAAGKRSVMSVGLGVTLPGANCVFLTFLTLLRM